MHVVGERRRVRHAVEKCGRGTGYRGSGREQERGGSARQAVIAREAGVSVRVPPESHPRGTAELMRGQQPASDGVGAPEHLPSQWSGSVWLRRHESHRGLQRWQRATPGITDCGQLRVLWITSTAGSLCGMGDGAVSLGSGHRILMIASTARAPRRRSRATPHFPGGWPIIDAPVAGSARGSPEPTHG